MCVFFVAQLITICINSKEIKNMTYVQGTGPIPMVAAMATISQYLNDFWEAPNSNTALL